MIPAMSTSGNLDAFLAGNAYLTSDSSTVNEINYDPVAQELYIEFLSGDSGYYSSVTPQEAREFAMAESQGVHMWRNFRGKKPWTAEHRGRRKRKAD